MTSKQKNISLIGLTPEQAVSRFQENINFTYTQGNVLTVVVPNEFNEAAEQIISSMFNDETRLKPNYTTNPDFNSTIYTIKTPSYILEGCLGCR